MSTFLPVRPLFIRSITPSFFLIFGVVRLTRSFRVLFLLYKYSVNQFPNRRPAFAFPFQVSYGKGKVLSQSFLTKIAASLRFSSSFYTFFLQAVPANLILQGHARPARPHIGYGLLPFVMLKGSPLHRPSIFSALSLPRPTFRPFSSS